MVYQSHVWLHFMQAKVHSPVVCFFFLEHFLVNDVFYHFEHKYTRKLFEVNNLQLLQIYVSSIFCYYFILRRKVAKVHNNSSLQSI